jgi:DNA-binding transcriptional regulator YhcF (GntR family)
MSRMASEFDLRVDRGIGIPLGAQLRGQIRDAVASGQLGPGDRLASVRELATAVGVNVNTVRAVYARLEAEGIIRSEHGRGTFVTRGDTAVSRRELRDQIAALEASLSRLPPPPLPAVVPPRRGPGGASLLSTEELRAVRDRLVARLEELDSARTEVLQSLERLGLEAAEAQATERAASEPGSRRATPSLAGARIRWVGA